MILDLVRLLGHVDIGAKPNPRREGERRGFLFTIDEVVPVRITRCKGVDRAAGQDGIQCKVTEDQSICREVALCKIYALSRLIVKANVGLVAIRQEHVVF